MAKINLENTREHDLTMHVTEKNGVITSVTVPGARQNPDNRNELIHGLAEVDDKFVEAARKASPVVAHYFDEGWLRTATAKTLEANAKLDAE